MRDCPPPWRSLLGGVAKKGQQPFTRDFAKRRKSKYYEARGDHNLVATGHLDKGAIISAAGDSAWAASYGFELRPDETKAIASIVNGDVVPEDKAYADGLYVGGSQYTVARADGQGIYVRSGRLGVAFANTKFAIIIGHHGESQDADNASSTVEGLADYLRGQGY
ncbi:hypothetical protein V500_00767 [Pseudogymnoascus sp. VKM F-4518 (FW-2643)]|nr:hypothetical protein V500_00767 [Pseudogymnoascus sp. VKM F-4518 (FW-2643)]